MVVKASSSKPLERMFLGEALGLKALRESGHLAIPEVRPVGTRLLTSERGGNSDQIRSLSPLGSSV